MRKQNKSLEDIQRLKAETRRQKEIDCVKKRIAFNNSWTDGAMWRDDAFDRLQDYLKVTPIWTNVVLNEENAFDYFDANPIIDKAFSLYLDSFDVIPYHPDLAFDIIWRVFEASLVNYGNTHWKPCPEGTHVLVTRASSEIISALANQDPSLKSLIQEYLEHIPLPLLRYMFARMYYERELGVSQQLELIQSRCKTILGDTYALIKDKYGIKKDSPSPENQRNAALLLGKILRGEKVVLGTPKKTVITLPLTDRIDLFINGILFTSRCERFHGDVPSPFKSSLNTSLSRYQAYYYLSAATAIFYYCILYKEASYSGNEVFSMKNLVESFGTLRKNISGMHDD